MPFLNIPLKTIAGSVTNIQGIESMPWYNPVQFPVPPGNPMPSPEPRDYRWRITMDISLQQQSYYLTRDPGSYNGLDVTVGQWIADINTGQAWQIISIESKTVNTIEIIVQDIYRYNTFRDQTQSGNGSPNYGNYIIFNISDAGLPQIDPVPNTGVSSVFTQNLNSRFEYINLQYDYPLYQEGNSFQVNDVIAANSTSNSFVLSDATNKMVIGRVTSISDTIPGWFTINPVQKVVDFLDYLPGEVGDIIYSSTTEPGGITVTPGGAQLYIKLRDNTSSITYSTLQGPTTSGNVFQLNGTDVTVGGSGTMTDLESAINVVTNSTGVTADRILIPSVAQTNALNLSPTYGEIVLWASSSPAVSVINGVSVTFDITSTTPGYEDYAQSPQMAQAINNANILNIVASAPDNQTLIITNTAGGAIIIVNTTNDINGVPFAGTGSGSGIPLSTSASTTYQLKLQAVDARAINLLDVVGSTLVDFGITSVENGVKAAALYIEQGLRSAVSTVVANLAQLNALTPLIGDQAYVIDSDDGNGNNVGEWSMWLYDGSDWIEISNQDSATTDAKSIEYTLITSSPNTINIGAISTGRRITLITVEVLEAFDQAATLSLGYQVSNPTSPAPVPAGLMSSGLIDLTAIGTYTTQTDILFGTDTEQGDVTITATFDNAGATTGQAQIIVSYV